MTDPNRFDLETPNATNAQWDHPMQGGMTTMKNNSLNDNDQTRTGKQTGDEKMADTQSGDSQAGNRDKVDDNMTRKQR